LGKIKTYSKHELIDPCNADHIYIVLDGSFNQLLYSQNGDEISFFRLVRGTIFGEMDYFRNFASHTYNAGLSDIFVNLKYQLFEKLTINNKFHYFRLANNNQNTPTNKNLGFENDLIINWKIYDSCALKCGYIFYIPSNSFKELKGVSDNSIPQFVYLQLSIKPTIFKSKKL
jgi:hypothetical protein